MRSDGARLVQAFDEELVPRRYIVLAVAAATFAAYWLHRTHLAGGDWVGFVNDASSLSAVPNIGIYRGPVALLFAFPFSHASLAVGWVAASTVCMALGLVTIRCVEQTAEVVGIGTQRDRQRAVLIGGVFLLFAWSLPGAEYGHADDVIVLTCTALAARALANGRWLWASIAIGVAIDTKPWAALALPLAAACSGRRFRGVVAVIVTGLVIWIPFGLFTHGGVDFASLDLPVFADSDLHYLGVAVGSTPSWPRALQLVTAVALGGYAVTKRRWYLVPAIAFAVRINLDPETWPYYMTGAVFGLFMWDAVRPARVWGGRTALGCIALLLLPMDTDASYVFGAAFGPLLVGLRLLVAIAPIAALLLPPHRSTTQEQGSPT